MRRNKNGKTVPQDLFVFLVLGLLAGYILQSGGFANAGFGMYANF